MYNPILRFCLGFLFSFKLLWGNSIRFNHILFTSLFGFLVIVALSDIKRIGVHFLFSMFSIFSQFLGNISTWSFGALNVVAFKKLYD